MLFNFEFFIVSTRRSLTAASLSLQNDQSQSEQVQGGSHVESTISFGRMSKRLTKGKGLFE
jgi:hypothetical protein